MATRMTHQQIADEVYRQTGYRVGRSSVSAALSRAGETTPKPRKATVPWRVAERHSGRYQLVMLRCLDRRNKGESMPLEYERRLNAWLARMDRDNAVVAYCRSTDEGFFYVPREPGDVGYVRREEIV